ncbi:LamG domain-containing protein [Oceanispirochaeta sp. M2]|uniref:LamG domain-containing protein n=1 Tax=Oceanispirochaeta sp. M2 TaxID=2735869 RepID=UPI001556EEF8|nr:LamG domain-containing protein [Oceanispirochaeta sp. M2]MBF9018794.1 LamG domain-containing protein [Oceanispirochaeta sp. M2]
MNNKKSSILLFLVISFSLLVIGCSGVLFDNPSDSVDTSTADTLSGDCAITAFTINGINGAIDVTDISLTLPYGTDLTDLVASFVTSGQNVTVSEVEQISGQTANNFSIPVEYTVYAENGDTEIYTVTACSEPEPEPEPEPYHPNTVSFWKFDENRGVTAYDSIGSNDGVIHGASWASGHNGSALSFDGVDDYVQTTSGNGIDVHGQALTLEAWVKWTVDPSTQASWANILFKKADSTWGPHYQLQHNSGNRFFEFVVSTENKVNAYIQSSTSPQEGEWYHVVGVYDGSEILIYVNGVLENSKTVVGNLLTGENNPLYIGSNQNAGRYFNGVIDEVGIYNNALNASEVLARYNVDSLPYESETVDLVSEWDLNENSGSVATDSVGDNYGTIYDATWTEGVDGSALSFDGTWDHVDVNFNNNNFDLDKYTISVWSKVNDWRNYWDGIFSIYNSHEDRINFEIGNDNTVRAYLRTNNQYQFSISSDPIVLEEWNHFVLSVDTQEKSASFYQNGELKGTASNFDYPSVTLDNFDIGRRDSTGNNLNGLVDELRVYNGILEADDILEIYNSVENPNEEEEEEEEASLAVYWMTGYDTHNVYGYDSNWEYTGTNVSANISPC